MLKFIRHYFDFAGPYRRRLRWATLCSFLQAGLFNVPIMLFAYALYHIRQQSLTPAVFKQIVLILAGSVLLRLIIVHLFHIFQTFTSYDICCDERISLGDHFRRLPLGFFSEGNLGRVTSILTQDLIFVEEQTMMAVSDVINGFATVAMGAVFLLVLYPWAGLAYVLIVLLAMLAFNKLKAVGLQESHTRQEMMELLTTDFLEYIMGMGLIKAFRLKNRKQEELGEHIELVKAKSLAFEKATIPPMALFLVLLSLITGALMYLSLGGFDGGTLDFNRALMITLLGFFITYPMNNLGPRSIILIIADAAINRFEALKATPLIDEDGENLPVAHYGFQFDHVDFSYDKSRAVLHDIVAELPEGSMTALVGPSGAGKTTMANLMMRFWDITSGELSLGNVPLKKLTTDALLTHMAAVFQRVYLFNDTIRNNILFGKPEATEEEMVAAAKAARCHDFIMALPEGYDTMITAGGSSLSGGEKQRISIARAILKDAPIIILDEATSAMDPDNEHHIQGALNELIKGKTVAVIAHRLHTIVGADQIFVIDEGKIVERGTHESLLAKQGLYCRLWEKREQAGSWKI